MIKSIVNFVKIDLKLRKWSPSEDISKLNGYIAELKCLNIELREEIQKLKNQRLKAEEE